jgi:hypothetical protein
MARNFKHGERIRIISGPLAGNNGVVLFYDESYPGIVQFTLDFLINICPSERPQNRYGVPEIDMISNQPEDISDIGIIVRELKPEINTDSNMALTIQDGFRIDNENKKAKYAGQAAAWKTQGHCPSCGEKGFFSHFSFVCTKHGVY